MKALLTTGKTMASRSHLENMMPKHANAVAIVPKGISNVAVGEKQLAIKQPRINPIAYAYLLLKKQKKTNISENLNYIGP